MNARRIATSLLAVVFGVGTTGALRAQTPLTLITGRVTDAATGQAIVGVQLSILGTTAGAQSNAEGVYTIRNVAPGNVTVRALRIGYAEMRQPTTATAGQVSTLNFQIVAVSITLSPIVTTATGDQRRVEVGNSIAQIDAVAVAQTRSVSNVADLLTSRAAGVMVIPGTQTGAGVRVRIRGTSSLALTNNPIYIIDGIRVEGSTGSSTLSVGGTTPSRVGDLNPEEIESIEVVRGPSASTLYGTDAANGVIVIRTKRGIAGKPEWLYYTEQTAITDRNAYPTAYRAWRTGTTGTTNSTPANTVQCFLSQQASGACAADSVTSFNLHNDPETTPYGVGYRQQHGLQVKGGSEAVRYFLHAEWEDEDGVTKVPTFESRYLSARGLSLLPEQRSPNRLTRKTVRTNLNIALTAKADMTVSAGFTSQDLRLPFSDDSGTSGIAANVYGGPGMKYNRTAAGDTLWGWRQFTPRDIYQATTNQAVERLITSVGTNYRPAQWLTLNAITGLDYTNRTDTQLCRFQNCPDIGLDRQGFKRDNRTNFFNYTLNVDGTATRRVNDWLQSKTTVGVQMVRNVFDRNGAQGLQLAPGATTVTAGALLSADESSSESRTIGAFVEENLAFRDQLFLTGALRSDRNSAFGKNFKTVLYPKVSASWVASEAAFMHVPTFVNQLRFRSAYGASGVQPGNLDGLPFYVATSARPSESGDAPAVVFSTAGNPNLKPERSTELELGVDATLWNNRLSAEVTYYRKISRDALISRVLAPSIGTASARLENLGQISNRGFEVLITAQILQHRNLGWDVTFNGSTNKNRLDSLGGQPSIGTTQQQREGYPLSGWWSRRLAGFNDINGNGIIEYNADSTKSEITVTGVSEFIGYAVPRTEIALSNGIDLFNRRIRVNAMIDYKGGHKIYNNTERIRCLSRLNCSGLINPNSTLEEQARVVMGREHPGRSVSGFFEDGDFLRFRELGVTLFAPEAWTKRILRGRTLSATVSARNLGILWTKYTGVDPEAFGTTGDAPSEFQAFAPPTHFGFRLNFSF